MTDSSTLAVSPFRRGLCYFGPNNNKFYLIFIHDLQSWTKKRLMEFFSQELPNYNTIIHSLTKKYSPIFGTYFIIRVDGTNPLSALNLILFICNNLPVSKKINWLLCNSTRSNRQYKKTSFSDYFKNSMPSDFLSNHLNSKLPCFNLCVSWNINGWNSEKKTVFYILYLLSNLFVFVSKKSVIANFYVTLNLRPPFSVIIKQYTGALIQMFLV